VILIGSRLASRGLPLSSERWRESKPFLMGERDDRRLKAGRLSSSRLYLGTKPRGDGCLGDVRPRLEKWGGECGRRGGDARLVSRAGE
jgi:hypothetical protein